MAQDKIYIAPSILSADYMHFADDLDRIATADLVHFDVMDGHFVPNLSFGPGFLKATKESTNLPLDVHLMISNPDEMLGAYLDAGADTLGFHIEATNHAHRLVQMIHAAGKKACVVINPGTAACMLEGIIEDVDQVLVMTVNPGFGGQAFIENSLSKIKEIAQLIEERNPHALIEVDGGISEANAAQVVAAGARILVAGSALFKQENMEEAIAKLRSAAEQGLA